MFCTNCGASNKDDAKFCVNCAESLSEVQIGGKFSRPRVLKDSSYFEKIDLLQALFDFSFNQFVGPKIMKLLYGLSIQNRDGQHKRKVGIKGWHPMECMKGVFIPDDA